MIVVQVMLSLLIPGIMWYLGRSFRNGQVPYLKANGIRYRSKRAAASEQAWDYANNLFFSMLYMSGINTGLLAAVLFIPVSVKAPDRLWILCASLIAVQAAAGFLLPAICTEVILRRSFDSEGQSMLSEEESGDERDE